MNGCMSAAGGMPVELSRGIAQLKGEHPSLLKKIKDMQTLLEQIDKDITNERVFAELKSNVILFKEELDPHSEREEGVLFPMMGKYIGTTSGPIAVMEYEHEQAKSSIGAFIEKAENAALSNEEKKGAAEFINNACNILTDHFAKEENVLFPMAERMLTPEEKEELYRRIQEI